MTKLRSEEYKRVRKKKNKRKKERRSKKEKKEKRKMKKKNKECHWLCYSSRFMENEDTFYPGCAATFDI